jgi:hypothetical protein
VLLLIVLSGFYESDLITAWQLVVLIEEPQAGQVGENDGHQTPEEPVAFHILMVEL